MNGLNVSAVAVFASPPMLAAAQTVPIAEAQRRQVEIDTTIALVTTNDLVPERAAAVGAILRRNSASGRCASLERREALLDALNTDMQTAGQDAHLRVSCHPAITAPLRQQAVGAPVVAPAFLEMPRREHCRLWTVEPFDGNIGYFKCEDFVGLAMVKEHVAGAMAFLHDSSAFIIDLTDNAGGASETAYFLLSSFLADGTRTMASRHRKTGQTTTSTVRRAPDIRPERDAPLYVLVSERRASAAEFVAYALQQAKRAVVVGSQTKGMANAGEQFALEDWYFVMVPTTLGKHPVSGTNWEGAGVTPDLVSGPGHAFDAAMDAALRKLSQQHTDEREKLPLSFLSQDFASRASPRQPPTTLVQAIIGVHEQGQQIAWVDDTLRYRRGNAAARSLRSLRDSTFAVKR